MNMSSGFIGNLIAFLLFNGKEDIDKDTRMTLGAILTSVSLAGENESLCSSSHLYPQPFRISRHLPLQTDALG